MYATSHTVQSKHRGHTCYFICLLIFTECMVATIHAVNSSCKLLAESTVSTVQCWKRIFRSQLDPVFDHSMRLCNCILQLIRVEVGTAWEHGVFAPSMTLRNMTWVKGTTSHVPRHLRRERRNPVQALGVSEMFLKHFCDVACHSIYTLQCIKLLEWDHST